MAQEEEHKRKKARFYDPDTRLKQKVGPTPFKKERIDQAQKHIESNDVDFEPMAQELLKTLRKDIDAAKKGELEQKELVERLTQPVMELKANAATFQYPIISKLMNILLNFLETLDSLDEETLEITEVTYRAVNAILAHKIRNINDKRGELMIQELENVILRYRKKNF